MAGSIDYGSCICFRSIEFILVSPNISVFDHIELSWELQEINLWHVM